MFKSSFAKYLTAFVIIILVSFLMLSGIITSMIRAHVTDDKRQKLELSCDVIASHFEKEGITDFGNNINSGVASYIVTLLPIVNLDYAFDILITDTDGKVLLSTLKKNEDDLPATHGDLGRLDVVDGFTKREGEGGTYLVYEGRLEGITDDNSIVYGKKVVTEGLTRGYAFALASTESEDRLISVTRRTLINSVVWVLIAAVIATYFITERIIHPLRTMTRAAKSFGKGDFSERVTVYGTDEVSELALAFNNMAESLESLEKMRNSFLANVSHDLRTPMTTIAGFIDGITSGAIPPEKHEYYLGVISTEVHRLSRLVSQLLDVSRLESGDRKLTFADFDIAELSRLVLISLEQKIDEKRLDVSFEAEEDEMIAYGDSDAIHQVVYNLCHNAIKFSNEGGKFVISISRADDKKIKVSVFDEGQVMEAEDLAHIFDRFYKSDKSRGLDKNGVGLGLYISKTIVEAHGEKIYAECHDGGSEFVFYIKEGTVRHKPHAQRAE
ncbi:MAG: HAMP domain-containing histidine kinase [Clostridia bacterium]|nr:HAMP domain-containing histidine kinase [Clostridia bacterium]